MAIRCAHSIADFSEKRGISADNIIANMEETEVFAREAADVAEQAITEGVARINLSREDVYKGAKEDIAAARAMVEDMKKIGHIKEPPVELMETALANAIETVRK
jgi:malate dehydrogenase (oxaloacetate-decarboxylating)